MTDRDLAVDDLRGRWGDIPTASIPSTLKAVATQLIKRRKVSFSVTDAATAGTAVTETVIFEADVACTIINTKFSAPIAVVASDTNFATVTISKRTAGGAATVVATQTTKITAGLGNLTAFVANALTLQAAAAIALAAGDVLTALVSKTGTGVALTAATSTVGVTVLYEEN